MIPGGSQISLSLSFLLSLNQDTILKWTIISKSEIQGSVASVVCEGYSQG